MDDYITLYNVVDLRTLQYHSVAVIREKNAKFFIVVDEDRTDTEETY